MHCSKYANGGLGHPTTFQWGCPKIPYRLENKSNRNTNKNSDNQVAKDIQLFSEILKKFNCAKIRKIKNLVLILNSKNSNNETTNNSFFHINF